MPKDPAILFYTSDFLTGTLTMTDEQVGKYIRLLCLQHQKGYLTEKDMISICKQHDQEIYEKFFKTEEGFYLNKRMQEEAKKRKNFCEKQKQRIKKRWDNDTVVLPRELVIPKKENININDIILKKELTFKEEVSTFKNYPSEMLKDFIQYWTEPNKSRTKLRYELEKTWDTSRRLANWAKNDKVFQKVRAPDKVHTSKNWDEIINDDGRTGQPQTIKQLLNKTS